MSHRWIVIDPPAEHAGGHLASLPIGLLDAEQIVSRYGDDVFRVGGDDTDDRLDVEPLAGSNGVEVTPDAIVRALAASGFSVVGKPDRLVVAETMARGDVRCWLQYAAWYGGFVAV